MQKRWLIVCVALAISVAGTSCSSSSESDLADVLPDAVPSHLIDDVSSFEEAIARDGVVELVEYERAVLATTGCLEAAGIWVSDIAYDGQRMRYSFDFGGVSTEDEARFVEQEYEQCYAEYQDLVDQIWAIQTGPSADEEEAFYREVLDCVSDLGYDVGESPTLENLNDAIALAGDDYVQCFDQIAADL